MAVRLMLPGEVCSVTCPPDYAYDKFKPRFILYCFLDFVFLHVLENGNTLTELMLLNADQIKFRKGLMFGGRLSSLALRNQKFVFSLLFFHLIFVT